MEPEFTKDVSDMAFMNETHRKALRKKVRCVRYGSPQPHSSFGDAQATSQRVAKGFHPAPF